MAAEIYLPKMSDHMEEGTIVRWLVKEGETVLRGQVILEIETDKAVGEIESPEDGVLKGVRAWDGATVPVGETIAYIARPEEIVPVLPPLGGENPAEAPAPAQDAPPTILLEEAPPASEPSGGKLVPATPVARRVAKELGVDISHVTGTGPGGRVKEEDVRTYAALLAVQPTQAPVLTQAPTPAAPPVQATQPVASPAQPVQIVELSNIQQITGQRMLESVHQAPHFFLQVGADMSAALNLVEKLRERIQAETGERLSVTTLLVKAAAAALKGYPRANSSYENGGLRQYADVNIGVAVGGEDGLVVPVIKNAAQKSLSQITSQLKSFQAKAKELRFSLEELSGGTFTISNLGMYGIDVFTAIINPPQSSILAVGRIVNTPVGLDDGSIVLRPLMALTLSVDHRCMDGMQAAKFLSEIKAFLEEPYLLL